MEDARHLVVGHDSSNLRSGMGGVAPVLLLQSHIAIGRSGKNAPHPRQHHDRDTLRLWIVGNPQQVVETQFDREVYADIEPDESRDQRDQTDDDPRRALRRDRA